jgi:hypothetical protein
MVFFTQKEIDFFLKIVPRICITHTIPPSGDNEKIRILSIRRCMDKGFECKEKVFYLANHQGVDPPLAVMTARMGSDIEAARLSTSLSHTSNTFAFIEFKFLIGCLVEILDFMRDQRFSMGFTSGDCTGHFNSTIPSSSCHFELS